MKTHHKTQPTKSSAHTLKPENYKTPKTLKKNKIKITLIYTKPATF